MENQHRQITGYRELNEAEIILMNEVKAQAEAVGLLVEKLLNIRYVGGGCPDKRWASIGMTQLQQGFMALTRSVAQPTTF